jgi:hypothetical protein
MGKNVGKERPGFLDGLVKDTPTHEYTHTHIQPKMMETKSRRVNLILKPTTVDRLDEYIEAQKLKGVRTSKNDVIQTLLDKFLDENI